MISDYVFGGLKTSRKEVDIIRHSIETSNFGDFLGFACCHGISGNDFRITVDLIDDNNTVLLLMDFMLL